MVKTLSHTLALTLAFYDEGTHSPFILAGPMVPQGGIRTDLVEHIDMAPTSLAVAGIGIPEWMQGRDLPDASLPARRHAFAARDRCDESLKIAGDPEPETEADYDDAMAEYLSRPNPRVEANIRQMKEWARQGR
jgi:arylsulfatase A-like enzyme